MFVVGFVGQVACGGISEDDSANKSLPGPDASQSAKPDAGKSDAPVDAPKDSKDALPDYTDPGCPDAPPPLISKECDVYAEPTGCGTGETCYPFIEYPTGPCEQEVYGAMCVPAGSGGQGDECHLGCKAGHVCVVSGQGTQCVKICDLSAPMPCPDGLVCVSVDVPGVGVCI